MRRRIRPTLVAVTLLLGLVGSIGLVACGPDNRPVEQRFQEALDSRVRRCEAKGASVAVILPDGTTWQGASGISHATVRMSPEMAFAIGSITKNMVAALVLQLAEEGKLSLEDPIDEWLPAYPHVSGSITIRQLLDHTSGLFMFWDNQALWDDLIRERTRVFTPEEVLGYLEEPYFAPGTGYRYSNTNYLLAAMIVTRATGSTLAAEMRRRFWEPLGLQSARLAIEEPYPELLAHVWGDNFEQEGAFRDITALPRASHDSITYGSAGVFMTARDLARWTDALYGGKVIDRRSLAEMRTFEKGSAYGLGLGRLARRLVPGARAEGHGGGNIGTTAYMVHLPDHGVSLAVMVNRFGGGCASRIVGDVGRIAARHVKPVSVVAVLWSVEGLILGLWTVAAVGAVVIGMRKDRPLILLLAACATVAVGRVSGELGGFSLHPALYTEAAVLAAIGLYRIIRRFVRRSGDASRRPQIR